ncbi:sugar nucleotide-binding protein [Candidatus Latescibacterota bacterium]
MYKNILLTGATGKLGKALNNSKLFSDLIKPTRQTLDLTNIVLIKRCFEENNIDAVIHCAALARIVDCEKNPVKAIETNIMGTCNIVKTVFEHEEKKQKSIRFIHISTDGVYPGLRGDYSENSETIPLNNYGWTKLGAESSVNLLSNFCIIRTRFFDPDTIHYIQSANDLFTSKITLDNIVKAIHHMLFSNFTGTINIGNGKKSDFEIYSKYKPSILPCSIADIEKEKGVSLGRDYSLDVSLWKKNLNS